jgi:hypothetical protein
MEEALQSLEAILQCLSVLSIWLIHDGRVESHVIVAMLAVSRGAWPLQLTFKAWRWAGIHCSSSPEPKPIEKQKMKITTKS